MPAIAQHQWVISPKFDTIFFLAPMLLGLLYFVSLMLAPGHALLITAFVWVVFAQTHFGSTWFIFFDKKNLAYYCQHPFIYFVMPVIIFIAVLALGAVNQTLLIILVAIASLYHVTKQNLGIMQLYRMRNKEYDLPTRRVENGTIFAWSLLFGAFGALQLPNFQAQFGTLLGLTWYGLAALLTLSAIGTLWIVVQYVRRGANSIPKTIFLITSILMYSPYLYASVVLVDIYQMEIATLTSLIAHYMQYIGIVWLINVNKYGKETEHAKRNPLLHAIASHYPAILLAILGYGAVMAGLRWGVPQQYPVLLNVVPNIVVGLMVIHFYIDSFIWRFRNPFIRETVLPFIRPVAPETASA